MNSQSDGTLLLTRQDVSALLTIKDCIAAVEKAFRLHGEGKAPPPGVMGIHTQDGGFHIKAGLMDLDHLYFAVKTNANFPQNPRLNGLPTIQGAILLCDAENGRPLAIMDSIEITILRTGAATAVAAKYLAPPDSEHVMIYGCGNQGRITLKALNEVLALKQAFVHDVDTAKAESFAHGLSSEIGVNVTAVTEPNKVLPQCDVCVTCTPSKQAYLTCEFISPGTLIAAVGADSPEKQELDPALMKTNKIVVDILEQCADFGELHHAIDAGVTTSQNVHAELGEIVAGLKRGRMSADEIIIFDSTGMALQDVISAVDVWKKAVNLGKGTVFNFA
jgi:ornithine cyclodeaminase/alanine dehydrogenase